MDLFSISALVVDDHEDTADLFAGVLEHAGAIVHRATNLLEAVDSFRQQRIDVVVTDLAMPGGSGWDVVREVRKISPRIPAVAVTAQMVPGARWLVDQGFSAVLFKPVDPSELLAVVRHLALDARSRG